MDNLKTTGGGIRHMFIFLPFGKTFNETTCFNIFNEDEDCNSLSTSLERVTDFFRERNPYVVFQRICNFLKIIFGQVIDI